MLDESAVRALRHRIVNDLNLVHGLLALAERRVADERASKLFDATKNRVRAIALVHRLAWVPGEHDPRARVSARRFVREISEEAVRAVRRSSEPVLELELGDVAVAFEHAIPLGLAARELVTNAAEHAFPDGRAGTIRVGLELTDAGEVVLTVDDDGIGPPANPETPTRGLGFSLVKLLAEQLEGRFELARRRNAGTRAELRFTSEEAR